MENTSQNPEVQPIEEPQKNKKKKFSILRVLLTLVIIFAFLTTIPFVIGFYHKLTYKEDKVNLKKCSPNKCESCNEEMCQVYSDSCKLEGIQYGCGPNSNATCAKLICIDKE